VFISVLYAAIISSFIFQQGGRMPVCIPQAPRRSPSGYKPKPLGVAV